MQDGLRLNFQVFSTKSGLSGRFYRQTKFSQRFRRKSGSGSSPSQRFSLISHESLVPQRILLPGFWSESPDADALFSDGSNNP